MKVVIRQARPKDTLLLLKLRRALWPWSRAAHLTEIESNLAKRGYINLIAFSGNEPVGFAEAMIRPFANGCQSQPVPFLEGLWVDPRFRRRDIGRKLVQAVESWAKAKGFTELGSDAYLSAHVSYKAHRAYGFTEMERVVYFRKKLR